MAHRRRPKVEQPSSDEDDEDVLSRLRNLQMSSGLGVSAIQHRNNNRKTNTRNENVSTIKNDEPPLPLPSDDVEALLSLGLYLVGFGETRQGSSIIRMRRFRAFFGVGPKAIKSIHDDLNRKGHKVTADKLFMAMNWLFTYDTEHVLSGRWKLNEKTIRESVRKVVQQVQSLKDDTIKWEDYTGDDIFIISVDGVHCRIQEVRKDPGAKWYDHKTNSAGVAYEVALGIRSGRIVWIRGPFPASRHDITTFRGEDDPGNGLIDQIPDGMRGIGDSAYRSEPTKMSVSQRGDGLEVKKFKARVKARQETLFSRLKAFNILNHAFRHGFDAHKQCFEACSVAVQYDIDNGHPLFEI